MDILWLLVPSLFALALLAVHSFFLRGTRISLVFFIASFIYGAVKENLIYFFEGFPFSLGAPYVVSNPRFLILQAPLVVCIGWSFTFYISWFLAERILARFKGMEKKLFPLLFLGALITAAISYCVEATGIAVGWWNWRGQDLRLSGFFLEGFPLSALEGWFFTFLVVMVPFFLIEGSLYKDRKQKWLFLLPSVVYVAVRLSYFRIQAMFLEIFILALLFYLSIRSPLRLEWNQGKDNTFFNSLGRRLKVYLKAVPYIMLLLMMAVMTSLDLLVIRDHRLLVSVLPLLLFVLLSFRMVPFIFVYLVILLTLVLGGRQFVFSFLSVSYLAVLLAGNVLNRQEAGSLWKS